MHCITCHMRYASTSFKDADVINIAYFINHFVLCATNLAAGRCRRRPQVPS